MKTWWKGGLIGLMIVLALVAPVVKAEALTFLLNNVFSGNQPAGSPPWLTATFTDTVLHSTVTLTLTGSLGAGGQFLTETDFNVSSTFISSLTASMTACTTCTTQPVSISQDAFKADGDGLYDISMTFATGGGSSARFDNSDTATIVFTCTGAACSTFDANAFNVLSSQATPAGSAGPFHAASHVQGIPGTGGATCSGWISDTVAGSGGTNDGPCTAVPEPITMFLGGTGLLALGYAARKRLFGARAAI